MAFIKGRMISLTNCSFPFDGGKAMNSFRFAMSIDLVNTEDWEVETAEGSYGLESRSGIELYWVDFIERGACILDKEPTSTTGIIYELWLAVVT